MANELQIFTYKEQQVRTTEIDGEIWFIAADVCGILELENVSKAVSALDDDEKMTITNSEGHSGQRGGAQSYNIINEAGLYKLIFNSRKPEAKEFTRWVTHDVLPQIRRTGTYSAKPSNDELKAKLKDLDIRGAEILQHMLDTHSFPLTEESKAVIAHEMFKLVTGTENRAMLPVVKETMYSATEIGSRFSVSKNKIGKIANTHGLKPPVGETNEYGTWIRTKSPHSAHECPQFMYNDNALDWFKSHFEQYRQ